MATLDQKRAMVQEISELISRSISIVVVDSCGLPVSVSARLREAARAQNIHLQVVRNRLAKLAVKDTPFESLASSFVGPTLLAYSFEAPGSAARLLKSFIQTEEHIAVKMISLGEGNLLPEQLNFVAAMPTRKEALAMIARIARAPTQSLAVSIKDVHGRLVRTLQAFSETLA